VKQDENEGEKCFFEEKAKKIEKSENKRGIKIKKNSNPLQKNKINF